MEQTLLWRAVEAFSSCLTCKRYGDGIEIATGEGKLYLPSVIDAASRRILGLTLTDHHDAAAAYGALAISTTVRGGGDHAH